MTTILTPNPGGIPAELKRRRQWVVFRTKPKAGGKLDKIPIIPGTYRGASTTDPDTWTSFENAHAVYETGGGRWAGDGFVFTDTDPYVGVDLDDCRDPETGAIEPWAQQIIDELDTYTEPSVTGTGVHLIARAVLPPGGRKKGRIEMYSAGRFFATTGQPLPGHTTIRDARTALHRLHERTFGNATAASTPAPHAPTPRARTSTASDAEVLERLRRMKGGRWGRLYDTGDLSEYDDNWSDADQGLANGLVAACEGDGTRADALFRQSPMMRPKWDERHYADGRTYGQATLAKAVAWYDATPTSERPAAHEQPPPLAEIQLAQAEAEIERLRAENTRLRAERPRQEAAPDGRSDELHQQIADLQAEVTALWELLLMPKRDAAMQAAAGMLRRLHADRALGDGKDPNPDQDGWTERYREQYAEEAGVNKKAACEGARILRDAALLDERPKPDDHRERPRFQQSVRTDYLDGLQRLVRACRQRSSAYVEKRGAKNAAARGNTIPPCPTNAEHPVDAVCRTDGTVVKANLHVRIAPAPSRRQGNTIPSSPGVAPHHWGGNSIPPGGPTLRAGIPAAGNSHRPEPPREVLEHYGLAAGGDA